MVFQRPRTHVHVNVGNFLELAGAGVGCYAVDRLTSLSWALVAAAVALIAGAELVYDADVWSLPLPRRPRPIQRARRLVAKSTARLGRAWRLLGPGLCRLGHSLFGGSLNPRPRRMSR